MAYTEWRGRKCRVVWNTGVKDENGKWIYDQQGGFTDEVVAKNYGLDREADIRNDRYIARRDGATLMREYCKTWPDTQDVGHLRAKAIRSMIRLYIEPRWGDLAVNQIKASAVRAWKIWLSEQPNIGRGYEREIFGVFSMMMDDAVEDGMRTSSPVQKKTRRGKFVKKKKERKRDMRMEDVFQLACNGLAFWGFPGFVYEFMMPFQGMRPAELYALRREYCSPFWPASDPLDDPEEEDREERHAEDLERYGPQLLPAVRVQWQHQRKDRVLGMFPPKYQSRRTLVLPPFLSELLEILLGSHDSEWVFLAIDGGLLANANFTYHYWRPIADGRKETEEYPRVRQGQQQSVVSRRPLPEIPSVPGWGGKRQYLKRHGHKEWMDEDGHSRIAVETRMGHEVAGVEGLYANVTPAMERRIMETLQERWYRFVVTLPDGWEPPRSPSPLPVDLGEWMKSQVAAARAAGF